MTKIQCNICKLHFAGCDLQEICPWVFSNPISQGEKVVCPMGSTQIPGRKREESLLRNSLPNKNELKSYQSSQPLFHNCSRFPTWSSLRQPKGRERGLWGKVLTFFTQTFRVLLTSANCPPALSPELFWPEVDSTIMPSSTLTTKDHLYIWSAFHLREPQSRVTQPPRLNLSPKVKSVSTEQKCINSQAATDEINVFPCWNLILAS